MKLFNLLTLALLLVTTPVSATNGYFTHGKGSKNKGLAGAGTALPDSAVELANNPASAVLVGNQFEVGASLFSPRRSYSTSVSQANGNGGAFTIGPNSLSSAREGFLIPTIARTWDKGRHAFGIAFYGRGGMNTAWQGGNASFDPDGPGPEPVTTFDGTYGAGAAGVDLNQAFLDLVYARRQNDRFAWGIGAVVAIQRFEATGIASFAPFTKTFSSSGGTALPQSLSDRGHELSYGGGLKLGFNAVLTPTVRVALAYQTKLSMTSFDDYADLFAEAGSFDIPATLIGGISFDVNDALQLHLDFEHTWYNDVPSVGNPVSNIFGCPTAGAGGTDSESCLGGSRGAGFGWKDVTTAKIGLAWQASEVLTWRAGFSHAGQPVPASAAVFNVLAPGVVENHYTAGFSRRHGQHGEWTGALMFAPEKSVTGANVFDPSQQIELNMHQFELELSYSWRYK